MSSSLAAPPTDRELVTALRSFPIDVLPVGLLRELAARGPAAEQELLRPLQASIEDAGQGVGCLRAESFFCFGLLMAHPGVHLLPTLEGLLRLSADDRKKLLGELAKDGTSAMLVGMARDGGLEETLAWIDRMIDDHSIDVWARATLVSVIPYLVRDAGMDLDSAKDQLITLLARRKSQRKDLLSAFAALELGNLGAVEFNDFVAECFRRGQIDTDLFDAEDWVRDMASPATLAERLEELSPISSDIIEAVEWWYGFPRLSHSLDPWNAVYEPNPASWQDPSARELSDAEIDESMEALRNSHDASFPREAVEQLKRHTAQVADRLIAEVRHGLTLAGGPDSRSTNGPFLALTLLIADDTVLPRDLLLSTIDLSPDDRADVFGDTADDALVYALALSLLGDTRPIDERMVDSQYSQLSRDTLASFYPFSARLGFLSRDEAIERLLSLKQVLHDKPELGGSAGIFEALCLMSPESHRADLLRELDEGTTGWVINKPALREALEEPSVGKTYVSEDMAGYCSVMAMIENSVMFDRELLHPPRNEPARAAPMNPAPMNPESMNPESMKSESMMPVYTQQDFGGSTTIRNNTKGPRRNDPCPCGSGKKYKKCCARK